jgi:outer membrane protein
MQKAISAIATESIRKDAYAEYFNVLDAVDNAYYAVLEAQAALEAEESSLQAAVLGFSIAEIRHSSGMINQGDYLKALADKEVRENSRNQARRNLTSSLNRFRTLTGLTGNIELEQISFEKYENVLQYLANITDEDAYLLFEEFWRILTISNPSLAKAALNTERAQNNLSIARRDYAPTISATLFSSNMSFLPSYNATGTSGVSIRGTIPIDFWVMNNRIERSRISRDSAFLDYESTESSLEQDLQNALFNLFSQAGTVLSLRRSLEYTERHFEFVMQRYRLLQSSVTELNDATSLFINSRNSLNRASYSFLQSLSRLRSLCALDDEERLLELLVR